ncbi:MULTISPECIES: type II toxin-antitoxin system VapC family toxin [Oceanibaculum]|uniref:PIN domain nuclease of toxin-antitoxin system n=1 Tax=Oceanibaculum indicum TaxID=526216 RepID=A0A420WCU6_9PROT|nr:MULTISPECIES: type II toxin-antitoxin system VapC family toxin [Oceanibaculum]MCH2396175.1 type II toxin-antitoxin system VapC family toxin [Oceanibaculum sp.]RKQ68803.1 PIN domain nuclease of toxin-antitoxin system [Oceanibaculum indicum]
MRLLLDTHAYLWWDLGGEQLHPAAFAAIADPENDVLVSAASVWEIAVKRGLGKLAFEGSIAENLQQNGFEVLPIHADHAERAGTLPTHHRDPFDRMLVAQTELDKLVLVTRDSRMQPYGIPILSA